MCFFRCKSRFPEYRFLPDFVRNVLIINHLQSDCSHITLVLMFLAQLFETRDITEVCSDIVRVINSKLFDNVVKPKAVKVLNSQA